MADDRTSTPAGDTAGPSSPPPQLPEGWLAQWEGKSRSWYYVSRTTGHSQWEVPTQPISVTPSVTPQPGTGYTHALPGDGTRGATGAEEGDRSLMSGKLLSVAMNSLSSGHGSSKPSSYGNAHSSSSSGLGSLATGVMQMAGKMSSSKPTTNQYGQQNAYGQQQQAGAYGNNAHGGQQSGNLLSSLGSSFFGKHGAQQQQQQQVGANPYGYGSNGQAQSGPYTGAVPQYNNGGFGQPSQHDQHPNTFQQPGMPQANAYGMTQGFGADAQGGLSTHFQNPAAAYPMHSQAQQNNMYAQASAQNTSNLYDPSNPAGAMAAPPQPEWHTKPRPNLQTPPSAGGYAGGYGTPTNFSQHMPSQLGVPTPPMQQQQTYSVPPPPPAPSAPPNQQPPPPGIQHHQQQQYQAYSPQPGMTPSFPPPPQQHATSSPGPSGGPYPGSGHFVPSQAPTSNDAGFYGQGHGSAHGTPSSAMPGFAIPPPPPPPSTGQTPQHSSYGGGQPQGYGNVNGAYGQQPQQSHSHSGTPGAGPYGHGVGSGGYY